MQGPAVAEVVQDADCLIFCSLSPVLSSFFVVPLSLGGGSIYTDMQSERTFKPKSTDRSIFWTPADFGFLCQFTVSSHLLELSCATCLHFEFM